MADEKRAGREFAVILHADVAGYTALMQRDEDWTHKSVTAAFDAIEAYVIRFRGIVCEKRGDALLARFEQPSDCLGAATMYQRDAQAGSTNDDPQPQMRIGINLGEVITDRGTIWGPGVNLAQRVEQLAEPGGVSVSAAVYAAVSKSLPIDYTDLGVQRVKDSDVHAYRAHLRAGETIAPPARAAIAASAVVAKPTIAVLPLRSLASDDTVRFIGEGLTEDLTVLLARVPGFFVVSRDSASVVDVRHDDLSKAAAVLGVRYLVTGSIRGVPDRLRVTIELVEVEPDRTIWRRSFDRTSGEDILELQSDIAREITRHIEPELARAEFSRVERRAPAHLGAWDLYHRANGLLVTKGIGAETMKQGIALLRQAIQLDPEFALAHAYLTLLYAFCSVLDINVDETELPSKALDSAERALALDGRDATVLGFAGCALSDLRQHQRGLDLLEQAVRLDPSNAQAQAALGAALLAVKSTERGIEHLRNGMQLSPLDQRPAFWGTILSRALFRSGRLDEAAYEAQRACQYSDTIAAPRALLAVIELARGDEAAAVAAFSEARRIDPSITQSMRPVVGSRGMQALGEVGLLD